MMDLKKISDFEWEIPVEDGMNVPGRIFASEKLMSLIKDDKSLEQVRNVARLPGILRASYAMPDVHQGYGFPIGGVAAFDVDEGVVCPGGVGYDINCSVRLLRTNLTEEDLKGKEKELAHSLFRTVPSGVGSKGKINLRLGQPKVGVSGCRGVGVSGNRGEGYDELDEVLVGGAQWAVGKGYGVEDDWKHVEDFGKLGGAEPKDVSQKAKGRGMSQLGSLGAGNHFLDVLIVDEVFDEKVAKVFGLRKGQVVILIHCGSRGLGHQVAGDYIKMMSDAHHDCRSPVAGRRSELVDRELVNAPIKSELGRKYLSAMACAANFAFANKQVITHFVREDMKHYFPKFKAEVVYDVCHNIAKFEEFDNVEVIGNRQQGIGETGKMRKVLVMRKGATRSFGPGRVEVPEDYRDVGQPVLIPGSMGTASYVLVGTKEAEKKSWGSASHGAGRVRSRSESHKKMSFEEAKKDMEERGVFVEFGSEKGMVEESPFSYKDIDEVVRVSDEAGLGKKVVKLRPLIVVIG